MAWGVKAKRIGSRLTIVSNLSVATLMTVGHYKSIMSRSWMSDTADEIEHPPIPLGLNKMAVPRVAIVLSILTFLGLLVSSVWVAISANSFLEEIEASFGSNNVELLEIDGRWAWEVDLLFDTCRLMEDGAELPYGELALQDDVFLYPGELSCDWEHQGQGDAASMVVYNRGNQSLDLFLEISGGGIIFSSNDDFSLIISELSPNTSKILQIELTENEIDERTVSITATHVSVIQAQVSMDVNIIKGNEERDLHIQEGDPVQVHYTVWDADTGEELDDDTFVEVAGDGWLTIDGFGWSAIGLDIDNDRGVAFPITDSGTSHITLLPPPIAYGNSEGHELENTWLRFELKLERSPAAE